MAAAAPVPPAGSDGKFTALRTIAVPQKVADDRGSPRPTSSCASSVDAAMCGVAIDLWQLDERPVGRRLLREDVEASAAPPARFDRPAQRRFVDQLSTRRVDDPDSRLAVRQPLLVRTDAWFPAWPGGAASEVGGRAQVVKRKQFNVKTAANSAEMNGSCATSRMPKACGRRATSWPILRDRRSPASCRAVPSRGTSSSPTSRSSSRDCPPGPSGPAPASGRTYVRRR